MITELLHGEVALLLTQVTMKSLCIITIADEFVGNILCLQLGATEDNGEDAGIEVNDTLQGKILVLGVHQIVDVIDVLGTLVA